MKTNYIQSNIKNTATEIYGITPYFNPQGIRLLKSNFARFRERLVNQGLKLLVIELANEGAPFDLDKNDAEILIQVRSESILWHKERLLNIGLQNLPKACTEIVWLDADIIFLDDDWVNKTSQLLKTYNILQPFSTVIRLKQGQYGPAKPESKYTLIKKEGHKAVSWCYALANSVKKNREPGFAWAAKKSVFDNIGFYDKMILGGADRIMQMALNPSNIFPAQKQMIGRSSKRLEEDTLIWQQRFRASVEDKVTFLPGTILHLFHGKKHNRLYGSRYLPFLFKHFDPNTDLKLNGDNCWEWHTSNTALIKWVNFYFWLRNPESLLAKTCAGAIYFSRKIIKTCKKLRRSVF